MSKILIAVLNTNVGGGITTSVMNLMRELCDRGHEVVFLDFSAHVPNASVSPKAKQIFLTGRARYCLLGKKDIQTAPALKKPFLALLGLIKKATVKSGLWHRLIFKRLPEQYDAAIAFRQCAPCYNFVLHKVKAKTKIGFVHGDVNYMDDISSWQPQMKHFDKIAYVSNAAKQNFIHKHPELEKNAATVYNMFDFAQMKAQALAPCPVTTDETKKAVVTVARIDNATKQIHWIPQICAKLKEMGAPPFHWYVLGNGADLAGDKALAEELKVNDVLTFTGMIPNPYPMLSRAFLSVLPSKTEGYCMTVMETLSLGVPLVATPFTSITEQMTSGKEGLITEMSVEAVAKAVYAMLTNQNGIYEKCKAYLSIQNYTNDVAYEQFMSMLS